MILYRVDSVICVTKLAKSIPMGLGTQINVDSDTSNFSRYLLAYEPNSANIPQKELLKSVTCVCSNDSYNLDVLETVGDAVLKIAVTIFAYWHSEHRDEGRLTKYRIRKVCNENLFKLARRKKYHQYIRYGEFTRKTWLPPGFRDPNDEARGHEVEIISFKNVADSVEALVGVHMVHCGYKRALDITEWMGLSVLYRGSSVDEE